VKRALKHELGVHVRSADERALKQELNMRSTEKTPDDFPETIVGHKFSRRKGT
jgi:hypothetical protein